MVLDMRGIGRLATLMVLECSLSLMVASMKAIGVKESTMARVSMGHQREPNMMEIGRWANTMESAPSHGLMARYIRVSGETAERMEGANSLESMARYMKENGRMVNIMGKES